jgi:hypothetical protein
VQDRELQAGECEAPQKCQLGKVLQSSVVQAALPAAVLRPPHW